MQVVVNLKVLFFVDCHSIFSKQTSVTGKKFQVFSTIFLFKCSDWRFKAKLTEQQVVAYLVKSEEEARGRAAELWNVCDFPDLENRGPCTVSTAKSRRRREVFT